MLITQAAMKDFDGIRVLLRANHVDHISEADKTDGFVTTNMNDDQLTRLIIEHRCILEWAQWSGSSAWCFVPCPSGYAWHSPPVSVRDFPPGDRS